MKRNILFALFFLFTINVAHSQQGCMLKQIKFPAKMKTYKEIGNEVRAYPFISRKDIYYIEPKYFDSYIDSLAKNNDMKLVKYQSPAQIIYFDWKDKMVSFNSLPMVEFENDSILGTVFDWNSSGMYNTFPPTDIYNSFAGKKIAYSDKNSPFFVPKVELEKDSILSYIHPLYEKDYNDDETNTDKEYDYTIVIFSHSLFLSYNSMAQLDAIEKNIAMSNDKYNIKVYLIMTDLDLVSQRQEQERKARTVKEMRQMCD